MATSATKTRSTIYEIRTWNFRSFNAAAFTCIYRQAPGLLRMIQVEMNHQHYRDKLNTVIYSMFDRKLLEY